MKEKGFDLDLNASAALTEEDIRQGKLVEILRQSAGYPVIVEFWNVQREAIIHAGKQAAKKKDEFNAAGYWMMLDGFDKACTMIDKIALRAEESLEAEGLEKEGRRRANQ